MARSKIKALNVAHVLTILGSGTLLYVFTYYMINIYPVIPLTVPQVDKVLKPKTEVELLTVLPSFAIPTTAETEWVRDLYHSVKQVTGKQVTLLVSDKKYLDILVNWLAHAILYAFQPVNNILIISFDAFSHLVLRRKGFRSIYVPPHSIMKSQNYTSRFAHIWVTRLTVIRILNYWNFTVQVFDSDAIVLRNIQPLVDKFNNSDIISSAGSYPFDLHHKWAVPTLCMGVFVIKSSPATGKCLPCVIGFHGLFVELFWYVLRSVNKRTDDQVRVNGVLDSMGIQWRSLDTEGYHEGITSGPTSLRVTTLPTTVICRYCKQRLVHNYYVWHHHAVRVGSIKKDRLSTIGLWLLQDNWNVTVWNNLTAEQWLLSITKT